jgi:CSLREA domain-containing protein
MKQSASSTFYIYTLLALLASLISSGLIVTPVHAAGIVVNSNKDTIANDGVCTLREAVTAANSDAAFNDCPAGTGADTITFSANYTITVGSQLPLITTQISIFGNGAANTIIQAANGPNIANYRVFEVSKTGDLTVAQVMVRNGRCNGSCTNDFGDDGGGIYNAGTLTVLQSTFSGNTGSGGGIYNSNLSNLSVIDSLFLGNFSDWGAGIWNSGTASVKNSTFTKNNGTSGGGITNNGGTLIVSNSTFYGNTATWGGGIDNSGTLTVTNSTFSGNTASSGGGISNFGGNSTVLMVNNTIADNVASSDGSGIFNTAGVVTVKNSIITHNLGVENCSGPITNGGNNLDSGTTCGWGTTNGSMSFTDPKLSPLMDHGGPTQTFALLAASPAIGAGNNAGCPSTDQRGISRPRGHDCDIGAFEVGFPLTPTFQDVPANYLYWEDIETLYANGLTSGCNLSPLKFCPGDLMNRGQAAVFMMRGAYGSSYIPPSNLVYKFNNDDWSKGTWARPWAEAMLGTGLTTGCSLSPLLYCPWVNLPREQAAIFGLKMKYGNSYQPPPAAGTMFADTAQIGEYARPWAEQAQKDGLIRPCGVDPVSLKPMFCPKVLVTRGLAAYIIVRAKNLTMP